jgi:hypothetical protein
VVERLRTRSREPEPDTGQMYRGLFNNRAEFVARQMTTPLVVPGPRSVDDYELCPQGLAYWYLHPAVFTDRCLKDWWIFIHDIRGVSGRHRHQGGLVLFVIEGRGYTVMNGQRYDWKAGDLIVMPLMPEGIEHQHFNLVPDKSSKWLAFINEPTFNEVGSEFVQMAIDPEWAAKYGITSWNGAPVATEQITPTV